MRHHATWLLALTVAAALGCGRADVPAPVDALLPPWMKDKPKSQAEPVLGSNPGSNLGSNPGSTEGPEYPNPKVPPATETARPPLETYLRDGLRLPFRLKSEALKVRFASNDPLAIFECAEGAPRDFKPCEQEDRYDFGRLVHNRAYSVWVRASRPDEGRVDTTPLSLAFVADQRTGSKVWTETDLSTVIPESADDLPGLGTSRKAPLMQVGGHYAVRVSGGRLVTSYATTLNYNSALMALRLSGRPELGGLGGERPCTAGFEYERVRDDGLRYCEGTPTRAEWTESLEGRVPLNHIEIVRPAGPLGPMATADERLLVAAYGLEPDPSEATFGVDALCQRATSRGETMVPLLYEFFDAVPRRVPFRWCLSRDARGRSWWLGSFAVELTPGLGFETGAVAAPQAASSARLGVIYAVDARTGIYTGTQFALKAANFIGTTLVPIAPWPDP